MRPFHAGSERLQRSNGMAVDKVQKRLLDILEPARTVVSLTDLHRVLAIILKKAVEITMTQAGSIARRRERFLEIQRCLDTRDLILSADRTLFTAKKMKCTTGSGCARPVAA